VSQPLPPSLCPPLTSANLLTACPLRQGKTVLMEDIMLTHWQELKVHTCLPPIPLSRFCWGCACVNISRRAGAHALLTYGDLASGEGSREVRKGPRCLLAPQCA